jgi:LysM repeat protein
VKSGDTLSSIAGAFGITVKQLRRANGLASNVIHRGQVLVIPAP